ncbi:unnamed protein product [Spirodela intermedia]|uniref:Uncharacterized protein n=1 Tax=Spirodela intermedia TaxID=51605 RepID=A0A7I8KNG6_SPIIN|nr:unnamed protein product [Spirodela intermedia]
MCGSSSGGEVNGDVCKWLWRPSLIICGVKVKEDDTFFPSEVEVIGVEPLFAEAAKYERGTEDDVICMNSTETDKYLTLEDFPYSDEFCSLNNDSEKKREEKKEKEEVLDGKLEQHDEQTLHVIGNISNACPDYLSESRFAERVAHLDYRFFLENLRPDEYNENLEVGSDVDEKLHLAHSIDLKPHDTFNHSALHPDAMNAHGLHDAFRSTYGRGTSILGKESLKQQILVGLSSLIDLDHTSGSLKKTPSEDENADDLVLSEGKAALCTSTDEGDAEVVTMNSDASGFGLAEVEGGDSTRKRTRKRTRRYIEESSEAKCTLCTERQRFPRTSPQDKALHVHWRRSEWAGVVCSEKSSSDGGWVSCASRPRRGRPRKNLTHLDVKGSCNRHFGPESKPGRGLSALSDSENEGAFGSSLAGQGVKCVARRKHHRLWTLAEVMKLIEGVSRYGVGRWTKIKRLLFSSSGHRTSVDLKDKWRNLLRASGAHTRSKNEIEGKKKPLSGLVPQSVLRRVRDLAAIHPYPRERASREILPAALSPSPDGQHLRCSWSSS